MNSHLYAQLMNTRVVEIERAAERHRIETTGSSRTRRFARLGRSHESRACFPRLRPATRPA